MEPEKPAQEREPSEEPGFTAEEIAEARRAAGSPGPWIPGECIHGYLQALQAEWDRLGGFDKEYMHKFLDELRSPDEFYYVKSRMPNKLSQ